MFSELKAASDYFLEMQNAVRARNRQIREELEAKLGVDLYVRGKSGEILYCLNPKLVKEKRLTASEVESLKALHRSKNHCFDRMRETDDTMELRELAAQVTAIEFMLQRVWGFEPNEDYHEWYMVPKCSCSKMDNRDVRGTKLKYISMSCKVHGSQNLVKLLNNQESLGEPFQKILHDNLDNLYET